MRMGNFEGGGWPIVSCAKTAELIEMPFGMWSLVGARKYVLDVAGGTRWHYLVNIIEPSMCGGDAALCQTTLTTCYY